MLCCFAADSRLISRIALGPAVSSLKDVAKKVVQKVVEQVVAKKPQEDAPAKEEASPAPKKTPEPKQAVKKEPEPETSKAQSTAQPKKEQPKQEQPKKEEAKVEAPAAQDAAPAAPRKCIRRRSSGLRKRANDAYSQFMIRSDKRDAVRL